MNGSYLPIGSIVMLRGGAKKLMVIGYFGVDEAGSQVDYMGLVYPEGFIDSDRIIGFNRVEIQEIIFEGYKSAEQVGLFTQLDGFANGMQFNQSPTVPLTQNTQQNNGNQQQ